MSRRKKNTGETPLRIVVIDGIHREILECGHEIPRPSDIFGHTNAFRRRCWKCRDLRPIDYDAAKMKEFLGTAHFNGRLRNYVFEDGRIQKVGA